MHYYKFNISDWGLGTSHLSLEEEAIYFRLINHYYDTELPISLETQSVFRRLRLGSSSVIANQILGEFFVKTDKGFVHYRCDEILKEYRKTAKKNKINGEKGGRPRKHLVSSVTQEKPSGLPVVTQEEPKHNPNQELITNNHKPVTKNQSNKKNFKPDINLWLDWGFPNKPSEEVFNAWIDMRKKNKFTMSELSFKSIGSGLTASVGLGFTVDQCLTKAENKGWKGMESDWMVNSSRGVKTNSNYKDVQPNQQGFLGDEFLDGEVISG